jgi:arylsulfatase A-like enzyme
MRRSSFVKALRAGLAGATCLLVLVCVRFVLDRRSGIDVVRLARGCNLILIVVDTLRADRLGCYGWPDASTPTLDSLAARGFLFESAFAQITTTVPSHASIMTSLYPRSHGIYGNDGVLPAAANTMAEALQAAGYRTGAVVGVSFIGPGSGLTQGFQHADAPRVVRRAAEVTSLAIEWLRAASGEDPFFLWVHYYDTHLPYDPPYGFRRKEPGYRGRFQSRITIAGMRAICSGQVPVPDEQELKHVSMLYDGEVSYVDSEVGRLLGTLRSMGLHDETVVAITADHGESHGEHGVYFDHIGLYDPTARIPLLLTVPGQRFGRRIASLVQSVDIMPTLLELMGAEAPAGVEGVSLVPVLRQPGLEVNSVAYSEHNDGALAAIRTGAWKLVLGLKNLYLRDDWQRRAGERELYDLREDPSETLNVGAIQRDQEMALAEQLQAWLAQADPKWGRPRRLDAETEQVLRQLGYLR